MKTCPTCGAANPAVLVNNVQDGSVICPACAPPSFSIYSVLTLKDLDFMNHCGIDPDLPNVFKRVVEAAKNRHKGSAT